MHVTRQEQARRFRALHVPGNPLLLANAWDAASAVATVAAGVPAVATTSAGVAWSLGRQDGDHLTRAEALESVRRIAGAVEVPVTADIEGGYGTCPAEVAQTTRDVIAAGAVGVNIEDGTPRASAPLREADEQAERIRAVRRAADETGIDLFINARIDTFLAGGGGDAAHLRDTLARARIYRDAGADGVFVPGLGERSSIRRMTEALDRPVNIMVGPGSPAVAELASWGVARVSLGASVACAAFALVARSAAELLTAGTYTSVQSPNGYLDLDSLLHHDRQDPPVRD